MGAWERQFFDLVPAGLKMDPGVLGDPMGTLWGPVGPWPPCVRVLAATIVVRPPEEAYKNLVSFGIIHPWAHGALRLNTVFLQRFAWCDKRF